LRLKKEQLSSIPLEEIEIKHYKGEKKPIMPKQYSTIEVLSLKVLPFSRVENFPEQIIFTFFGPFRKIKFREICILLLDHESKFYEI